MHKNYLFIINRRYILTLCLFMTTIIDIPDNIKIDDLFEKQDEIKGSEEYKEYLSYLTKFFSKDRSGDKRKYNKGYKNDSYILQNIKNKKDIIIEPTRIINLYQYEREIVDNLNEILWQIAYLVENFENISDEERENFSVLKFNYINLKKQFDEINNIQNNFNSKLSKLFDSKIKLLVELSEKLLVRNNVFYQIGAMITIKQKKNLMRRCKEGLTTLNQDEINILAKDYKIPNKDVENWIKWIYACKEYIEYQNKLKVIGKEIYDTTNNFDKNMTQFIYQPPELSF